MRLATIFVYLTFYPALSWAADPLSPEAVLAQKLNDLNLSRTTTRMLKQHIFSPVDPENVTVEDIVRLKDRYFQAKAARGETLKYLTPHGLRFNMTAHDVKFYKLHGRVPERYEGMDSTTDVGSLHLSPRSTNILRNEGIETLGDHLKTSLEELLRAPNAGIASVHEIKMTFEKLGFPIPQTQQNRECLGPLAFDE